MTSPHTRITFAAPTTTTTPGGLPTATPAFASIVSNVTAADLGSSYRPGCPVGPEQLRRVQLKYRGFDGQPHVGTLIVNRDAVNAVVAVFGRLYAARFPIRRMDPIDVFGGSDDASMAADNTSAFNCRYVADSDPPRWSAHAYGRAIDVNTVENPYVLAGSVKPPAGASYLDRSAGRPGTAYPGGELVSAFAAVGWQWGGRWSDPDYQHFSSTGG